VSVSPRLLAYLPLAISTFLWCLLQGTFVVQTLRRRKRPLVAPDRWRRVSILKPMAGKDDDLAANLESFAKLEYPSWQLLIGVASSSDPALPVARAFVAAHPEIEAKIVLTDPDAAQNPKVAQLLGLLDVADGELLLISDANVRTRPGDLAALVAEISRPGVGIASSVVVGTGERTLGAALENLQLGAQVAPGVIATSFWGDRPLTIGKSMMIRREVLAAVGGLEIVGNVLAEDHVLARIVREHGYGIGLCFATIENRNTEFTVSRSVERHLRWAKIRRAIVPVPFVLEPLLCPLIMATLTLAVAPDRVTLCLIAAAAIAQTAAAWNALSLLRGKALSALYLPLEVVRAYLMFALWLVAFSTRRVSWRGHPFILGADSTLTPAGETLWRRLRRALVA
jgi:ceramide glucosyltransferase